MVDALSDRALVQSFVEKLRYKHVSYLLNLVAAPGNSFHANAQGTKFFNPTPNSRAGNADFARDLRSADHNHRVVGKQRQQRVDATVSRPTQICLRHNNLGNLACDTWLEVRVARHDENIGAQHAATLRKLRRPAQILFELREPFFQLLKLSPPLGERC